MILPPRGDFMLDPGITFLNHGSFGATPRPVFECYQQWQQELERQPVEFLGRRAAALMGESRAALGEYLGTAADNLVYVTNATTGLNIVARSLELGPGDEVLASDHEYGALDRTWRFLSKKRGFHYINHILPAPIAGEEEFIESVWSAVTPSTRVIFLSHITSPTAITFPVKEICRRAREHGILTVIDGAHAPGQIDLDLEDLGADIYSGNLHKWLCAPKGAAFLYARPEMQPRIEPLVVSWGWESDFPTASRFVDEQEWTGTRDLAAFLAVPAAITYQKEYDWPRVREHCHGLLDWALSRIRERYGLPQLHPDTSAWYAQMGTAELPPGIDIIALKTAMYDQYRVEVPLIEWNGRKLVRVSIQAYNTPSDVNRLLEALPAA
ncbi:MAG TPA: aminotransferase class V-fold PLP-dependent enzyme [Anaerolineaceae bacterium]